MEPEPDLLAEHFDDWYADMTGSSAMDEIMCVDAIQFAQEPDAAYREIQRVLASAGRAVLTCWEPLDRDDERLPGRLRRVDLGRGWPLPGSATLRSATVPAGGPVNAPCGRKLQHSTRVMTPRCAHSITRACAPSRSSVCSAGS